MYCTFDPDKAEVTSSSLFVRNIATVGVYEARLRTMVFFMVAISSLLAAIVLAVVVNLVKYHGLAVVRKLPGPKPNWLFGNALQLARLPDGE